MSASRERLFTWGAVIASVLLVGSLALADSARGPSGPMPWTAPPHASVLAAVPTTSPAPGTASPSAAPASWARLTLPKSPAVADLVATRSDAAGVALDTMFRLTTRTGEPATSLAGRLSASPDVGLAVVDGAGGGSTGSVLVRPARPLVAGEVYRFSLASPEGRVEQSWAFQAAAPLHVVTTVPGNRTADVPLDTGIEFTFDQDGVTTIDGFVSASPAIPGKLEYHGRTAVLVPSKPLAKRTLYTVTLRHGVPQRGSDQVLERDVVVEFQTGTGGDRVGPAWTLARRVYESVPGERPVLETQWYPQTDAETRPLVPVVVYRFAGIEACLRAYRAVEDAPQWVSWPTPAALVPTASLDRIATFSVRLTAQQAASQSWLQLPLPLDAGWYLVTASAGDVPYQAFLQVTDVATFASVTETKTAIWVNDAGNGTPLAGSSVTTAEGTRLGTTDGTGLVVDETPAELIPPAVTGPLPDGTWPSPAPLRPLVVRTSDGRAAFVPLGANCGFYGFCSAMRWVTPGDRWWQAMGTDRTSYRESDTIHVWGVARERGQSTPGPVPASLELRLVLDQRYPYIDAGTEDLPPVETMAVTPDSAGTFSGSLAFTGLDHGTYRVEVRAAGELVSSRTVSVGVIVKPAYTLSIATDRRAYIAGETITETVTASYYDGTPVPGVDVQLEGLPGKHAATTATTGIDGTAVIHETVQTSIELGEWGPVWLSARVARAEEGEIAAQTTILVFQAERLVDGAARIDGSRVRLAGSLAGLDLAAIEKGFDPNEAWRVDPHGAPIPGSTVRATIVDLVPVKTEAGRHYDFIQKRTVIDYRYDIRRVTERTLSVRTDAAGAFVIDVPVANPRHQYEIDLASVDPQGRAAELAVTAAGGPVDAFWATWTYLEPVGGPSDTVRSAYLPGSTIALVMRNGSGALPAGGSNRYLFLTEQRGLRDARVQGSPRLDRTFGTSDVPSLAVVGVRFTGSTYQVAAGYTATVDASAYELTVEITPDAGTHRPGDLAAVDVRATDGSGRPVAATVVVRAVDQKLYDSGAAFDDDPLLQLYAQTSNGEVATYASHQYPSESGYGRGSATAGSGGGMGAPAPAAEAGGTAGRTRTDFRDTLFCETVTTGTDGRAHVPFRLSDDLTGWHVSATAFAPGLRAGQAAIGMPVGLPFFVAAQLAPEYLTTDVPSVRLRAYGTSLRTGDRVTFTVASTDLGMAATTASGAAFDAIDVPLSGLRAGDVSLTIEGSVASPGGGGGPETDRLVRTFRVVDARQVRLETWSGAIGDPLPSMGTGLATVVFDDRGTGRLTSMLQSLAWGGHARVDEALAAVRARRLLAAPAPATSGEPPTFDVSRYQLGDTGGISLLPYASPDLELSALVALTAPDDVDRAALVRYLTDVRGDAGSTSERRNLALAGLAGLGDPVLPAIQAALRDAGLTTRERLYLAAGALALGDAATALAIERSVLEAHGETLGPWIRVRLGGAEDLDAAATALVAWLAAGSGDPVADGALQYVLENPPKDVVLALEEVEAAGRLLATSAAEPSSFSYAVDGIDHPVALSPGGSYTLALSAAQRATLRLTPGTGTVGISATWRVPLAATAGAAGLSIERTVDPAGTIDGSRIVEVSLAYRLPSKTPRGCYEISDVAPSGLVPISRGLLAPGTFGEQEDVIEPYAIDGQLVSFCAGYDGTKRARYFARVVTPGTYTWEPAVIDSGVSEIGAARGASGSVVIR